MKKVSILVLLSLLAVSVGTAFGAGAAEPEELVIGSTVYTTQHEFYADVISGMEMEAEEQGVRLVVSDANSDVTTQTNQIDDYAIQRVDAMIVYGVDPVAIVPAVEEAVNAGIPVVTCDMPLETDMAATFIGSDNWMLGEEAGKYAVEYIENELGGEAKIGVVTWLASVAQQERFEGFEAQVKELPGVEIVAVGDGDGREEAMSSAEDILQANPDLDLMYGSNEGTVVGSMAAIESAGRDVPIVGVDISQDVIRGIEQGQIIATIAQQPVLLGQYAVQAAIDAIDGKELDDTIVVPVETVTSENVDDFK